MPHSIVPQFKRQLTKKREGLKTFLKKFDDKFVPGMQKYVDEADKVAWAQTDCLECANCCKVMTPTFTKADLKRISAHFRMSEKDFYNKWLKTDEDNGDKVNKVQPCQFLDLRTNKCSIYEIRPEDCATFPHFQRKPFAGYNHVFEQNIEYCPATLKFISHLQDKIEEEFEW